MDNKDHLRLIADPTKLLKKEYSVTKDDKTMKLLETLMIHKCKIEYDSNTEDLFQTINNLITKEVAVFQQKLFVKEFVKGCIEKALKKEKEIKTNEMYKFDIELIEELSST